MPDKRVHDDETESENAAPAVFSIATDAELQHEGGSGGPQRNKRVKRTKKEPRYADEDPEYDDTEDRKPNGKGARKKMRETVDDSEDEEDLGLFDGTQTVEDGKGGKTTTTGIIQKIVLKDFLCHHFLEVKFGKNVNYVSGANGSGKSAILTGIVVALGGKAATSGRGANMKDLIRTGCPSASVALTMYNDGADVYRPEQYGKLVTIERTIKRQGGTSYRITGSRSHKTIATTKEEVVNICDFFNIQIDNPIMVLNQDASKSFLTSAKPSDMYKFFMKATLLEKMSEDYQSVNASTQVMEYSVERRKAQLPRMEQEVKAAEQRYIDSKQVATLAEQLKKNTDELIWAQVIEKERVVEQARQQIEHDETVEVAKLDKKIHALKQSASDALEKVNATNKEMEQVNKEIEDTTQTFSSANAEMRNMKKSVGKQEAKVTELRKRVQKLNRDKANVEKAIVDVKNTSKNSSKNAAQERLINQVRDLEGQLDRVRKNAKNDASKQEVLSNSVRRLNGEKYETTQKVQEYNKSVVDLKRRIAQLEKAKKNRVSLFGDKMPEILRDIDREKGWSTKPLGPIGNLLHLKDMQYDVAVGACLASMTSMFIANDAGDLAKLKKILSRYKCRSQIVLNKIETEVYRDFARDKPKGLKHPTVMDVLEAEHPHVLNVLIDQKNIHKILLIKEPKEARDVMFRQRPNNVTSAYTKNGDQLLSGKGNKYYSARDPKRFQATAEDESEDTKRKLEGIQKELVLAQRRDKEIKAKYSKDAQAEQLMKKKVQSLERETTQLERKIRKLNDQIEELAEDDNNEDYITQLEDDLTQHDENLQDAATQRDEEETLLQQLREKLAPQEQNMSILKHQLDPIVAKLNTLKETLENHTVTERKFSKKLLQKEDDLARLREKIAMRKEEVEKLQKEVDAELAEIESQGIVRVEPSMSVTKLEHKIAAQKKTLAKKHKENGDPDAIAKEYDAKNKQYLEVLSQIKTQKKLIKLLRDGLVRRNQLITQQRTYQALRIRVLFTHTLQDRKFDGSMHFDHQSCELELKVKIDSSRTDASSSTHALSGGERSFSTVAFICALWDSLDVPFRCLDEFDVHMDMINRQVSVKLLTDLCQIQSNKQFIFLTPLNLTKVVQVNNNVRIIKLENPRDGQRTLNETT